MKINHIILLNLLVIFNTVNLIAQDIVFNFEKDKDLKEWFIVNDDVMGGISESNFSINKDGNGIFQGYISIENNGGFSSVKYKFSKIYIKNATVLILRIKGDSKNYQFRIKANSLDKHSYITKFSTTGEWQDIEIPLKNMYPSFRGKKLDIPNFFEDSIDEIAFLIANKCDENFELTIDTIELK